mmetsp:Transcript_13507/g.31985  ORF Transcript_13507/g.31985 Transcript_13507/m.31985 type:complete len:200 (-) Transcript_13507:230-829(-)
MVLGTPTTLARIPASRKCCARIAALVLESSPPTTTSPSSASDPTTRAASSSWAGVSILSRPEPMMSKPPWLRNGPIASAVTSAASLLRIPAGPLRNPRSCEPGWCLSRKSSKPAMTLWPPAAWPPESTTPTRRGAASSAGPPLGRRVTPCAPASAGNRAAIRPSGLGSPALSSGSAWKAPLNTLANSGIYSRRSICKGL